MFWSFDERAAELKELGGDLERLKTAIDFETFRPLLQTIREKERKDTSGCKPFDVVLMFKILVLQTLHNLSDEMTEYQIKDRISFMNFLGLGLSDTVPDGTAGCRYDSGPNAGKSSLPPKAAPLTT